MDTMRLTMTSVIGFTLLLSGCATETKPPTAFVAGGYAMEETRNKEGCMWYRITKEGIEPGGWFVCNDTLRSFSYQNGWLSVRTTCGLSYHYHPATRRERLTNISDHCPVGARIGKMTRYPDGHAASGKPTHWIL